MKTFGTREWIATGLAVIAAIILFFGGGIWNMFKGVPASAPIAPITNSDSVTTSTEPTTMQNISKTPGLEIYDLQPGTGEEAKAGLTILAHYVGTLTDGTKFDSSIDRGQPFEFTLGVGQVIQGWDKGIEGMKVGGVRKLVISPELGYGSRGAGNLIPPNATLIFEVKLVAIQI